MNPEGMRPRIESAALVDGAVHLAWHDSHPPLHLPLVWLRDHCRCERCLHPVTLQRQIDSHAIPGDLSARIEIEDDALVLHWMPEGHSSRFPAGWLERLGSSPPPPRRVLWDRAALEQEVPRVAYEAVMAGDQGLGEWLEKLDRYGLCFVAGVPVSPEATRALAERVAYIRQTIFGGFWDFTSDLAHKDTAYTNLAIGPHTDGTYSFDAPGAQMFHCLHFQGGGGESTFVDGFHIGQVMRQQHPEVFRLLAETPITGQYLDPERGIHLQASRPLFRLDASSTLVQVSFNPSDRAPFLWPEGRTLAWYRAMRVFTGLALDASLVYRRRLVPGEVVLFDNWRVLHGRTAFEGERRLCGVYLNKEDVESRLRGLRA